jgi:hypothetical protein
MLSIASITSEPREDAVFATTQQVFIVLAAVILIKERYSLYAIQPQNQTVDATLNIFKDN